ncbi:MAG: hypothetical protein ACW99U_16855 [Candidatus Thorarchaeota archaeon]|jgi:hypothetical protein
MKWIKVCNTIVDVERYRLFMLDACTIEGLNEFENGESRITEAVSTLATDEQAAAAFEAFCEGLIALNSE